MQVRGDRATATLAGEVGPFVRAIASPALEDLTIEPASLEEAFLEFYADGEGPVLKGRNAPGATSGREQP